MTDNSRIDERVSAFVSISLELSPALLGAGKYLQAFETLKEAYNKAQLVDNAELRQTLIDDVASATLVAVETFQREKPGIKLANF